MKKIILLACTLILAACDNGSKDAVHDITSRMMNDVDYNMTIDYSESGETKLKYEYTHIAAETAFDVKGTVVEDGVIYTITYKTLKKGNAIENLKVVDQNGEEYETNESDHEAYITIMSDNVIADRIYMMDLDTGRYTNVSKSESETTYDYLVTDAEQKDIYKFYKDLSGYTYTIEHGDGQITTTVFKFL